MNKNLHRMFAVFSIIYLVTLNFPPLSFSWVLKIIPIALLMFGLIKSPSFPGKLLLLFALLFSATGDVLLEMNLFIFGVGAFLISQLHYAVFFTRSWKGFQQRWPISLFLIAFILIMATLLTPNLGEDKYPVFAYLFVIAIMGIMATQSSHPFFYAVAGALVFISSDSIIAIDRFIQPIPLRNYLVMFTYFLAQWMIINGCLRQALPTSPKSY